MFEKFFGSKSEEENKKRGFDFTNNHLLNVVVREYAFGHVSEIEDVMMGGREQVYKNIDAEIERLRQGLPEEERGN